MRFPGFIGPSYLARSVNVDCQRCVNMYPEKHEVGGAKEGEVMCLIGTPGKLLKLTLAAGVVRGIYTASNGRVFAVGANKLYEISSTFVATELGTLNTTSGSVSMSDNGLHLVIVDGPNGYKFEFGTNIFANVIDPNFMGANFVTFQDGYFIFNKPSTGQFYISGLNDTTIDPLDFASSEGSPDPLVSIISVNRNIWALNEKTTEIFFNSGNADFPFQRVEGGFVNIGIAARFSVASDGENIFWLGQNTSGKGIVYMAQGYNPQRISTHAIEFAIQGYSDFSDATAFCYQMDGHRFYILNFPTANRTWCFDLSTGLWHERAYTNMGLLGRDRANYHTFGHGIHLIGDYENGKIYELSYDYNLDDGQYITRKRVAPHISSDGERVFHSEIKLDMETGVGLDGIQQGTDPQIMLKFSDDGGHSWSNEKWTTAGKIGRHKYRAEWRRLGSSRDRVYDITITDPVKVVLIGAELEIMKGAS